MTNEPLTSLQKGLRRRAWRNAMVSTINSAVRLGIISLDPEKTRPRPAFRFEVVGIPTIAHISDAGWDELSVKVGLWPSGDAEQWVACANGDFQAGECFAHGWLERRKGRWLQTPYRPYLRCKTHRLSAVAGITIEPEGYEDHGRFMF